MISSEQKYVYKKYNYPKKRDITFILGAGASYPDGAPIQSEILPIILSGKYNEIKKSNIGKELIQFINDNFYYDNNLKLYPSLEEIFAFLDFFINQKSNLNSNYSYEKIKTIKESLIKIIHFIISYQTRLVFNDLNKRNNNYKQFWEFIKKYNRNISIITLNYDTLLEEAFDFLYPNYSAIDYCIHFINYDAGPGMIDAFNWWDNPKDSLTVWGDNNPIPIKILKVHGSINWKYCKTCNRVLLTPWQTDIDLKRGAFIQTDYELNKSNAYRCPYDKKIFETLIIQPSYIKELSNPIVNIIYHESLGEIINSKKIIFIGYSFPEADIHIKALLKQGLINEKKIFVIDVDDSEKFKFKYKSLSKEVKFLNLSFEELLLSNKVMERLLS